MIVRFRSEAAEDVALAKEWYDTRRPGLGDDFSDSLEEVIGLVAAHPEAFHEIAIGLRRALVGRFPYAVYYRLDSNSVDVIACLHTRRSLSRWRGRD